MVIGQTVDIETNTIIGGKVRTLDEGEKRRIADLERQKIDLEDKIEWETDYTRQVELERELYEINDTIKKIVN